VVNVQQSLAEAASLGISALSQPSSNPWRAELGAEHHKPSCSFQTPEFVVKLLVNLVLPSTWMPTGCGTSSSPHWPAHAQPAAKSASPQSRNWSQVEQRSRQRTVI